MACPCEVTETDSLGISDGQTAVCYLKEAAKQLESEYAEIDPSSPLAMTYRAMISKIQATAAFVDARLPKREIE